MFRTARIVNILENQKDHENDWSERTNIENHVVVVVVVWDFLYGRDFSRSKQL